MKLSGQPEFRSGLTLTEILIVIAVIGLVLSIGLRNWSKGRVTLERKACVRNLQTLQAVKEQWAIEYKKTAGAAVKVKDITPYLKSGRMLVCPAGGRYTVRALGINPTCNRSGHVVTNVY